MRGFGHPAKKRRNKFDRDVIPFARDLPGRAPHPRRAGRSPWPRPPASCHPARKPSGTDLGASVRHGRAYPRGVYPFPPPKSGFDCYRRIGSFLQPSAHRSSRRGSCHRGKSTLLLCGQAVAPASGSLFLFRDRSTQPDGRLSKHSRPFSAEGIRKAPLLTSYNLEKNRADQAAPSRGDARGESSAFPYRLPLAIRALTQHSLHYRWLRRASCHQEKRRDSGSIVCAPTGSPTLCSTSLPRRGWNDPELPTRAISRRARKQGERSSANDLRGHLESL